MRTKLIVALSAFLLLINMSLLAQDKDMSIIKLKSGDEVKAKIIAVTSTEVEYKSYYFQSGQSLKLSKSLISYVINPDGTKEVYDSQGGSSTAPVNTSTYNSNPAPTIDAAGQELKKSMDNVNTTIQDLNKGQQQQTQTLSDALKTLNESVQALKASMDQGNAKKEQHDQDLSDKMTTVNKSIKDLKEQASDSKDELQIRKFGFGVTILANFSPAIISSFYDDASTDKQILDGLTILSAGVGLQAIINTGVDKKAGLRFEPEITFASGSHTTSDNNSSYTDRASIVNFSAKFMGCIHRKKVNVYAGPVIGFGAFIDNTIENDNGQVTSTKISLPIISGGFCMGGEYLIDPRFSVGLETNIAVQGVISPSDKGFVLSTGGKLVGRFYF